MLRTLLLLPIVLGSLTVGISADPGREPDLPAREPDLAGTYLCTGNNPDGSTYEGVVEIVKHNDVFQLLWIIDSEIVGVGIGIRSGDVLAVAYYSGDPGVVAYRIEGGDRLVGQWTTADADGALSSETLTRVPPDKVPPDKFGPSVSPSEPESPPIQAVYIIPERPPD